MLCADAAIDNKETGAKYETVKHTEQQSHDNKEDDCSPFCHCTCCAGFSVNHPIAWITAISSLAEIPKTAFLSSKVIEIALPVWQPPQI